MALYRLQGKAEKRSGIFYEFDPSEEPLGVGGMGKVYKGRCVNEVTGNAYDVAIKFMFSDLPSHAIERARREAAIQIRHDNLVEMLGFIDTEERGVLGDIQHHYHVVSELLEGIMLDDLLQGKLTNARGESIPYAQKLYNDYQRDPYHFALYVIRNVLSGLMALHDAGYIHRDIDPTNIMVTSNGHIKLIDFGIAKQLQSLTTNDKSLTVAGVFMGKPEYAAPELILGDIKSQDKTTDIYAVGILLFQCIIGHPPFEGDSHEVMNMQLHQKMPLGIIKNKQIRKIIETATDKSRAKRYRSAAEFRVALDQVTVSGSGGNFEWKPLYTYILGGVAACVAFVLILVFAVLPNLSNNTAKDEEFDLNEPLIAQVDTPKEIAEEVIDEVGPAIEEPEPFFISYATAIAALNKTATASEGLKQLEELSAKGDADATFLLSRLYFKSKLKDDFCPDSIIRLQKTLMIKSDNSKAHQLLEKAISQKAGYYQALYELACDYWKADQRTEAVKKRDAASADKAIDYFCMAMTGAKKANDREYIKLISAYRNPIQKWLGNVKDMPDFRPNISKWEEQIKNLK